MGMPPAQWENTCDGLFKEFRVAVLHLRRDREVLDLLEDKESVWRFICKFCRERPFQHDRCTEVLKILLLCDKWMEKFGEDPEVDIKDLPSAIADEFSKRVDEINPGHLPDEQKPPSRNPWSTDGVPPPLPPPADIGPLQAMPSGLTVVVQRCVRARVLIDEKAKQYGEIGRGLLVSVSFSQQATQDRVFSAARFLLLARLSTAEKVEPGQLGQHSLGSDAESVIDLCKRGIDQGVLIIPQASLASSVGGDDWGLSYSSWCTQDSASDLYKTFADALRSYGQELVHGIAKARPPVIVASDFNGRQFMEVASAGPFMHSFNF
jgi:D-Tyr-tRNAtyr deacylase